MRPKLTVGMAHFRDYNGVWFTIQNLRTAHPELMEQVEFVVIDNDDPNQEDSRMVRQFTDYAPANGRRGAAGIGTAGSVYVSNSDRQGTSIPRDMIFQHASGEIVCVMDCHLVNWKDSIPALLKYFDENPESLDIVSGPLFYDDLTTYSTHYDPQWRGQMFGTWSMAWTDGDIRFSVREGNGGRCSTHDLLTGKPVEIKALNGIGFPGHEKVLLALGMRPLAGSSPEPGLLPDGEPFEIPGQGLGMFACRREAWLGFNKDALGFGGEELYVHDKFRLHGRKAICIPQMAWTHRFGRPGGAKYPASVWNKVRNYVLETRELEAIKAERGSDYDILLKPAFRRGPKEDAGA
jgi:hypothetical protein